MSIVEVLIAFILGLLSSVPGTQEVVVDPVSSSIPAVVQPEIQEIPADTPIEEIPADTLAQQYAIFGDYQEIPEGMWSTGALYASDSVCADPKLIEVYAAAHLC